MIDYREVLRLNSLGNSQRSIANQVQSSRNTVAPLFYIYNRCRTLPILTRCDAVLLFEAANKLRNILIAHILTDIL